MDREVDRTVRDAKWLQNKLELLTMRIFIAKRLIESRHFQGDIRLLIQLAEELKATAEELLKDHE